MIVAEDGSGDFTSIQDAINTIPSNNSNLVTVFIKSGVYKEKLHIEKPYVRLKGEDTERTVITFDDYAKKRFRNGDYYNTFYSYSFFVGADDFQAENLTIVNSAGRGEAVGQALAAYIDGDRVSFRDCRFIGCQDTLFTAPLPEAPVERATFGGPRDLAPRRRVRQYYESCYIEGDVDFIFGSATAVFNRCEIFSRNRLAESAELPGSSSTNGWITAASTPEDVRFGYVFKECRLTGDAPRHSVYLGRPWRNHAKVAFLNCWMGAHIKPEGWHNWDKQESERTTRYCEYNSSGPGNDAGRRAPWSRMLRTEEAEIYSIANVLSGNDGWNPETDNISRGVTMPRINVFLAGDSTVSGNHAAPMEGWGEVLQSFMNGDVTVHNEAFSGRSSKSFIDEGRLDQIEANIGSGDYLLIQFGHNDQKPDEERRTEPFSTYKSYLKRYIDVARSKEAVPVLISSVQRRKFDEHGNHLDTHGDYPMAMKQLAEECDVPFIDLDVRSKALLESLGPEQSKSLFVWLEPGESLNYPDGIQDDTHFSEYGAKQMAQLVIEAIEQLRLPLSAYIVK